VERLPKIGVTPAGTASRLDEGTSVPSSGQCSCWQRRSFTGDQAPRRTSRSPAASWF